MFYTLVSYGYGCLQQAKKLQFFRVSSDMWMRFASFLHELKKAEGVIISGHLWECCCRESKICSLSSLTSRLHLGLGRQSQTLQKGGTTHSLHYLIFIASQIHWYLESNLLRFCASALHLLVLPYLCLQMGIIICNWRNFIVLFSGPISFYVA